MFYKREVINVQVSRRVLWVGAAAYPLHNIARVTTVELEPRLWLILKRVGPWGFAACAVFMGMLLYSTGGRVALAMLVGPPVLAGAAVLVVPVLVRLIRAATRSTLHRLNIETAGAPYAVLTSPERIWWRRYRTPSWTRSTIRGRSSNSGWRTSMPATASRSSAIRTRAR